MIVNFFKQHRILSKLIAIIVLTVISCIIFLNSTLEISVTIYMAWWVIMGISVMISTTARIALYLHDSQSRRWQMILLAALWILVVGVGTCGSVFMLTSLLSLLLMLS